MTRGAVALVLALLLAACSPRPAPVEGAPRDSGSPPGSPCVATSDCVVGALCGYAVDAGCAAQGVCVPEDLSCLDDGPVVCGCDGTGVGLACIYGAGYAPLPVTATTPGCSPVLDAGFGE